MPQDSPRTESQRGENQRSETSRSDRSESSRSAERIASTINAEFVDMGARSVKAGLRMQKEMFDALQDIGKDWFARATTEAELAFKLPNRLTSARSIPDAFSAYQEWLSEWLDQCGEDGRRLISDGQKIMDTGVRCFTSVSQAAAS